MEEMKRDEFMDGEEVEVVDLEGEPFEIIGDMEFEGSNYLALIPFKEDEPEESEEDEEDVEFIILKSEEGEDGEYTLSTIDDDEYYKKIGDAFLELFADGS